MRSLLFSIILLSFAGSLVNCRSRKVAPEQTFRLIGSVTQTSSYCGGARPSDEIIEEHNRPKPYPNKSLAIVRSGNGERQLPLKVESNDSGYFFVELPLGTYNIFQQEQLDPPVLASLGKPGLIEVDSICFSKWLREPLETISITDRNTAAVNINFHHPCFISGDVPCQHYVGPMPP